MYAQLTRLKLYQKKYLCQQIFLTFFDFFYFTKEHTSQCIKNMPVLRHFLYFYYFLKTLQNTRKGCLTIYTTPFALKVINGTKNNKVDAFFTPTFKL